MPQSSAALQLKEGEERQLRQWVSAFGTPQQVALRSKIVLAGAEGQSDNSVAGQLEVNRKTVTLWRARFREGGLDSLWEVAEGRGRKPTYAAERIHAIVDATLRTKPQGMTRWSCRSMADSQGVSKSTINNIWQSHNIKPHRVKTFKLSRDAKFLTRARPQGRRGRHARSAVCGCDGPGMRPTLTIVSHLIQLGEKPSGGPMPRTQPLIKRDTLGLLTAGSIVFNLLQNEANTEWQDAYRKLEAWYQQLSQKYGFISREFVALRRANDGFQKQVREYERITDEMRVRNSQLEKQVSDQLARINQLEKRQAGVA